jgi:hypothetical protein
MIRNLELVCVIVFCACLSCFTQGFVSRFSVLRRSSDRYVNAADELVTVWTPHSILGNQGAAIKEQEGLNSSDKEKKRQDELIRLAAVAKKAEAQEQEAKQKESAQTLSSKRKDDVNLREMLVNKKSGVPGELLSLDDLYLPVNEDTDAFEKTQIKPAEAESKGGSGVQDMLDTIVTTLAKVRKKSPLNIYSR